MFTFSNPTPSFIRDVTQGVVSHIARWIHFESGTLTRVSMYFAEIGTECAVEEEMRRRKSNCHQFQFCLFGRWLTENCEDDLIYDHSLLQCVADAPCVEEPDDPDGK